MSIYNQERVEHALFHLSQDPIRYTQSENSLQVIERKTIAGSLYDFLTDPVPEGSDYVSFVKAFGKRKDLLWTYGLRNIGTDNKPLLWGLQGIGDLRGVNFMLYIPVKLRHTLDEMYHGETNEPITPYHKNLLETLGEGTSGRYVTIDMNGKDMRFVGNELTKEEFITFMSFGSDYRLQCMAQNLYQKIKPHISR